MIDGKDARQEMPRGIDKLHMLYKNGRLIRRDGIR